MYGGNRRLISTANVLALRLSQYKALFTVMTSNPSYLMKKLSDGDPHWGKIILVMETRMTAHEDKRASSQGSVQTVDQVACPASQHLIL